MRPLLLLLAAFFLGAGAYSWREDRATGETAGGTPAQAAAERGASSRSGDRDGLELQSFWQQRGSLLSSREAAAVALEAARSGVWDEAARKAAVWALIHDPGFINPLWAAMDPEVNNSQIGDLLIALARSRPLSALEAMERATFTPPGEAPPFSEALMQTAQSSPCETLALLLRSGPGKIIPDQRRVALQYITAVSREASRTVLDDLLAGGKYETSIISSAYSMIEDRGSLPSALLELPQMKEAMAEVDQRKLIKTQTDSALKPDSASTPEEFAKVPELELSSLLGYYYIIKHEEISAEPFERIAIAHPEQQIELVRRLADAGRGEEVLRLLEQTREMPGTKAQLDDLYGTFAAASYRADANPTEAIALLDQVQDESTRTKYLDPIVTDWAEREPEAAKAYLPSISDPKLRDLVEKIATKSSLDSP